MLLFLIQQFCSSVTLSLSSAHLDKRLLITEQYILYTDDANAIPLYDSGSLGSLEDDFGIGLIIHFPHIVGAVHLLKHTLNKMCKKLMVESFCNTSLGILSKPQALPCM